MFEVGEKSVRRVREDRFGRCTRHEFRQNEARLLGAITAGCLVLKILINFMCATITSIVVFSISEHSRHRCEQLNSGRFVLILCSLRKAAMAMSKESDSSPCTQALQGCHKVTEYFTLHTVCSGSSGEIKNPETIVVFLSRNQTSCVVNELLGHEGRN
jgi:hypothetical protein